MKFDYFTTEWHDREDWIRNAEKEVNKLWTTEYKCFLGERNNLELPLRHSNHFRSQAPSSKESHPCISSSESAAQSHFTLSEFGVLPSWKKHKQARIAADKLDPYERFIQKEVEDEFPAGPLQYWLDWRSDRHQEELARMGMEVFSIPAMSADPERLFSRYASIYYFALQGYSTNSANNLIKYKIANFRSPQPSW